jgi:hypothetical protein
MAEAKKLRYRLLHAAARIARGVRRLHLRIAAAWPRRHNLANAFACPRHPPESSRLTCCFALTARYPRNPWSAQPERRASTMPVGRKNPTTAAHHDQSSAADPTET